MGNVGLSLSEIDGRKLGEDGGSVKIILKKQGEGKRLL